ncbi:hypothetical protein C8Q74DRAFT_1264429 [Fomes fomentarius]|nr:hypothetical protein C8Q74DRAFT_1264429 [Fomes fomentarius]
MSITFFGVGCFLGFGAYGFKKAQELARDREAMKSTETALTTLPQDPSASPAIQPTLEVTEDLTPNTVPSAETAGTTPVERRSRFHADTALPADPSPSPPTQATLEATEDPTANAVPPAEPAALPAKARSQCLASIACPKVDMTNAFTSAPRRGSPSKLTSHVPTLRNLTSIPIIEVPAEDVLTGAVGDVFVPIKACPGDEDTPAPGRPLTSTSTSTSSRDPQPAKRSVCMNSKVRVRTFKSTLPPSSVSSPSSSSQTSLRVTTPSPGSSPDTSSHQLQSSIKPPRPILKTRAARKVPAHILWVRDAERVPATLKRRASALGASRVRRALSSSRSL